ncbi:MAG: HEAT repeat domain-containing protein [Phycisphaerae bacterium]
MKSVISCALREELKLLGLATVLCLLATTATAPADVFHLENGGSVEGLLLEKADGNYRIRTTIGTFSIPVASVVRIEEKETPFAEYDRRAAKAKATAKAQFELAKWCGEHDLLTEQKQHLKRAVELETDFAPARAALGYVKQDGIWVIPAPPKPDVEPAEPDADADVPIVEDIDVVQGRWTRQIRALMNGLLKSRIPRLFEQGRERILSIDDPRAIFPLSRELGKGNLAMRSLLVDVLARFREDEATLNLAVLGLVEENDDLRHRIVVMLKERDDPRVISQYRRALHADADGVVANAAFALGRFRAESAVPDLIQSLTAERNRVVEITLPGYFSHMPGAFATGPFQHGVNLQGVRFPNYPTIGVFDFHSNFSSLQTRLARRNVIVMRTEVLEALKQITGENFGFNLSDWTRWYNREWIHRAQEK